MDNITRASAAGLAQAIRARKVSSEEAVDAYLKRIESINPALNAVVQLRAEAALAEARQADARLARGDATGPLHGVPVTVKDSFETAGMVSTGGTEGRKLFVPDRDATAVERMRSAGAILLGKTNVPELSLAYESDNLVYGRTNNPYSVLRTPGGSSGGEAAAIAAGASPLGLGSDSAGSIRLPAHFCGIAGIKPTTGLVPATGLFPPYIWMMEQLSAVGPMARFVEDLTLVLPILAGTDWLDPATVPVPPGDPGKVALGTLRAAFYTDNGIMSPTSETAEAVKAAAGALSDAGLAVLEDRPDIIGMSFDLMHSILSSDGGSGISILLQMAGTSRPHTLTRQLLDSISACAVSAAEFGGIMYRWRFFRCGMLSFLKKYDVIICPACALPAMPHGAASAGGNAPAFSYAVTYNLTGWPAVVVRGGTSPEGLPIGVQVVARPWCEDVALAAARHIEKALGGWQPPPIPNS
ncbi:MAG: amidase [Actinobacteria bacterium]|nr:amidase [Actinomycetota bacterium]